LTVAAFNRNLPAMKMPPRLSARLALGLLLALAAASFLVYPPRAARLTIVNVGVVVDYAPIAGALLLAFGALAALAGVLTSSVVVRLAALALTLTAVLLGLSCLTFSITAERDVLRYRHMTQRETLAWTHVSKVEYGSSDLVVVDLAGRRLRLSLAGLTAQQRAAFDRTLARRIWESGPSHVAE
jgi:hypothetical protein